jgi:hypothetical protein
MAPPPKSVVLADTMAIKAAHDLRCWNALRNTFQLHTVPICITEATRYKKGTQLVARSAAELEREIKVAEVTEQMRLDLEYRIGLRADVHDGERDLMAYALTLREVWWLCGPDNGTLRAMHALRLLDRMVSLETLSIASGHRATMPSKHYTDRWLIERRTQLRFDEI